MTLVNLLIQASLPVYYYPFAGRWLDRGGHEDYSQAATELDALKVAFLPHGKLFGPSLGSSPLQATV